MQASKVSFFSETKLALTNPILSKKKKRELRINRLKDYIRSQPVGTTFRMMDLMAAAGYDPANSGQYASGFGFLTALNKRGIIDIERTTSYQKLVTIPGDETTRKISDLPEVTTPEKDEEVVATSQEEDKPSEQREIHFTRLEYQVVDVETVRMIENLAREFSWTHDSDSLREFIKSIK